MIPEFEGLSESEVEVMLKSPVLVCILIAGADGKIDRKEIKEAISTAAKHAKSLSALGQYLKYASEDFEDKIIIIKQSYPREAAQRETAIVHELSTLNTILPKIDKSFAQLFYSMLKELAIKVATSSGGWLGMNAVGSEEARYIELKMINQPV